MIYGAYCVRDIKSGYLTPNFDINDACAKRNFEHACSRTDSLFFTHPHDYQLFKIGEFNTENGEFDKLVPPEFLMDAPEQEVKNV